MDRDEIGWIGVTLVVMATGGIFMLDKASDSRKAIDRCAALGGVSVVVAGDNPPACIRRDALREE